MKEYYSLIRRADFTDLFKYGQLYLNSLSCKEISTEKGLKNCDNDIIESLFRRANCFESSFSYLVIQFQSSSFSEDNPLVNIENVSHIYPLDHEAKREFETSFDNHIRINEPIWANAYSKIQEYRTRKDCEKGAENIWKIYKVHESIEDSKQIISEDIIDEVVKELYENRRPSGNLSVWVYLLRYERHAYYPQGVIGYFLDAVNIICNYITQKEVDEVAVNNTAIGEFLNSLQRDLTYNPQKKSVGMTIILDQLLKSSVCSNFISKISEIESRVKFLNVAVAYLILKDRFRDGIKFDPEYFKALAESGTTSKYYGLILYLLGITLGHDKTYECLYENLPLPIFKSKSEMEQLKKRQEYERMRAAEEMRILEAKQNVRKFHSAEDNNEKPYSIPQLPCLMGKLKKGSRTEICKTPKPIVVKTKEEYITRLNAAWIEITNKK